MRILFVIAQTGFRDEELIEPMELFQSHGIKTTILSKEKGTCTGSQGLTIKSDQSIEQAIIDDDVKAIVVVGGPNSPSLMKETSLQKLLVTVKEKEIYLCAICLGPMVVASFGLIDGISATVYPTEESLAMLQKHNIKYNKEDVVVDGKIITANGPHAATAFGHTIMEQLE